MGSPHRRMGPQTGSIQAGRATRHLGLPTRSLFPCYPLFEWPPHPGISLPVSSPREGIRLAQFESCTHSWVNHCGYGWVTWS